MQPEWYFSSKGVSAVRVVQIFSGSARLAGNVGCYQQSKRGSLTGGLKDILFHFVRISTGSQKQSNFCGAVLLTERTSWNFYVWAAPWSLSSSEESGYSGSHLWGVEVDDTARSPSVPCLLLFYSALSQYYKHQPPPKPDKFLCWSWRVDMADQENDGKAVVWCLHHLPASRQLWKDETPLPSMGSLPFLPAAALVLWHSSAAGLEETCGRFLRESLTERSFVQVSREKNTEPEGTIREKKSLRCSEWCFLMMALTTVTGIPLLCATFSSDWKQYTSVNTCLFTVAVFEEFLLGRAVNWQITAEVLLAYEAFSNSAKLTTVTGNIEQP